jgi:hypothetical protein
MHRPKSKINISNITDANSITLFVIGNRNLFSFAAATNKNTFYIRRGKTLLVLLCSATLIEEKGCTVWPSSEVLDTKNDVITLAWNLIKEKFMCSKIILLR